MIHLFLAILVIFGIYWISKKFYFPTEMAEHPEKYPTRNDIKISKKEMTIILTNLQRWRKEGKITREEYDRLTDICLSERPGTSPQDNPEDKP